MSIQVLLILSLVGVALAAGDFAMKEWSSGRSPLWYFGAMALYIVGLSVYGLMLRRTDFAAASYAILIFNMVVVAFVGYAFFPDRLSFLEMAGIVLGIGSVVCFTFSTR